VAEDEPISQEVALPQLADGMSSEAVRVEITLLDATLVARLVVIDPHEATGDDEELASHIVKIAPDQDEGSLTLVLGELIVNYTSSTEFFGDAGDELTMQEFVELVTKALSDGQTPGVRARRAAPDAPQDPDDATFTAAALRLSSELEEQSVELNIEQDNLKRNDSPPPDGWITVLGLPIELRVTEGITTIRIARPEFEKVHFHDRVESVDLDRRTFTLADGKTIGLREGSRIKHWSIGNRRLRSLEAVARALEAGLPVSARGTAAVIEGDEGRHLVAIKVEFRTVRPMLRPFAGKVTAVDLDRSAFTLNDHLVIRVTDDTRIVHYPHMEDGPGSLKIVHEALEAGNTVYAAGIGTAAPNDEAAPTLTALLVKFVHRPPDNNGDKFAGIVAKVDVDNSLFTLDDGTVVNVLEDTRIGIGRVHTNVGPVPYNVATHPPTLQDIADALAAGLTVRASGTGVVVNEDPRTIDAAWIWFAVMPAEQTEFAGTVEAVDLDERTLTLDDETVIQITKTTRFDPPWLGPQFVDALEVIARALDAGLTVATRGVGQVTAEDPLTILATEVTFHVLLAALTEFNDEVTSVDLDAETFTLADGTVIQVVQSTKIDDSAGALPDLDAVADALSKSKAVTAEGTGAVYDTNPRMAVAIKVRFST
jgi:predicted RNA-binding protein